MRHAVYAPPFGTFGDVHVVVDLARRAETAGWDGFFLWDHVLHDSDAPFVDAWIALAAAAAATERIRLGPMVTPLPRRRPWKVAREAVTLDHLSRGRLTLGVGLGIDFWREYSAFAEPADDDVVRAELLDEGIEVLTRLFTGETVHHRGKRLVVDDVRYRPRPVQAPRIPIWSAAIVPVSRRGPVRRAARCDGVFPFRPGGVLSPEDVRALRIAIEQERGDADFDVCAGGRREELRELEAAGLTWRVEGFGDDTPLAEVQRVLDAGPPGR